MKQKFSCQADGTTTCSVLKNASKLIWSVWRKQQTNAANLVIQLGVSILTQLSKFINDDAEHKVQQNEVHHNVEAEA